MPVRWLPSCHLAFVWYNKENFFKKVLIYLNSTILFSVVVGLFGLASTLIVQTLSARQKRLEQHRKEKLAALEAYMECYGRVFCGDYEAGSECALMAAAYRACLYVSPETRDLILDHSYHVSPRVSHALYASEDETENTELDLPEFMEKWGVRVIVAMQREGLSSQEVRY